jgi:hypothetical protein
LRVLFVLKSWQIGSIKVAPLFFSKNWFFLTRERNSKQHKKIKLSTG